MHLRIHEREKRFKCDQCPYEANRKGLMETHKRSVHENLFFECNQCEYKASQKSHLKPHIQAKHEEGKPCTKCDFMASSKRSLKLHDEKKHLGVTYICSECNHPAS